MYKGYHFSMANELLPHYFLRAEEYKRIGRAQKEVAQKVIQEKILSGKWVIAGDKTESEWFPQLKKHVFISHSHKDEDAALLVAGLLKDRLGIDAFVDSAAWGCYRGLAKCLYEVAKRGYPNITSQQDTQLRMSATEHAHCMLSKSLIQMMDRCECLMFLDTPASVGLHNINIAGSSTFSPWIYTEIEAIDSAIYVDEVHFQNAITNLMDNAVKYRKPDEPIDIYIKTWNDRDHLYFSIRDTGQGIKKENVKKIFEKFYRVHTGNVHDVKGFGLGLAYVKKIINLHDGEIKCDSELGKGTTFTISLPVLKEDEN